MLTINGMLWGFFQIGSSAYGCLNFITNIGSGYLVVKMLFFSCCQCCHWSLSLVSKFIYVYHANIYIYMYIYVYYIQTWLYTATAYIQLINRNWKRRWDRCRSDVAGVLPMPAKTTAFQKSKSDHFPAKFPAKCIILFIFFELIVLGDSFTSIAFEIQH